jgi:DNA-binding CsgD family transcriptional regulator
MGNGDSVNDGRESTLLHLIDSVYAAAVGESGWDAVVAELKRAGHFDGVAIVAADRRRRCAGSMLAAAGLGRCRSSGRSLGSQLINPLLTEAVLRSKPGAVWFDHEIMPSVLWADTDFRERWMGAQGLVGWACMIIGGTDDTCVYLEVYASATCAPLGHRALTLLSRLAPHLCRAWRLGDGVPLPVRRDTPSPDHADTAGALPPDAVLRSAFGLTRAEARLAMHLAAGQSLASAADAFGVRMTTLRSQLAQVYSKTGTGRQCELVSLILRRDLVGQAVLQAPERLCA